MFDKRFVLFLHVAAALYAAPARTPRPTIRRAGENDADALLAQAESLRREVAEAEAELVKPEPPKEKAKPPSLRIVLPMSKPDWSVVDEEVEFVPYLNGSSRLLKLEVPVPCGLVLEEQDDEGIAVVEIGEDSNAERAGVRVGDRLRATSAVRAQMEMPTWQLLGGGIGRPKLFRFIFGCDLKGPPRRTFEDVLGAVASNREDPEARPALLVLERSNEM